MKKICVIFALAFALSGCNALSLVLSRKVHPQPVDSQSVAVFEVYGDQAESTFKIDAKQCWTPEKKIDRTGTYAAPLALALMSTVGGLIVDSVSNAALTKVQEIQGRAVKAWTVEALSDSSSFRGIECFVLVRYSGNNISKPVKEFKDIPERDLQMALLIKKKPFGAHSYLLTPLAVKARSSIALTGCEENCWSPERTGKISMSIAINQFYETDKKEIGQGEIAILTIQNIAINDAEEGVVTYMGGAPLVEQSRYLSALSGITSTPVAYVGPELPPATDDNLVARLMNSHEIFLKFVITENGTISGMSKAEAESKAWSEAVGTTLKEQLKSKLEPSSGKGS